MNRRQPRASRAGTFLLVLGCLGVLGATFGLGVVVGRSWPRALPWAGPAAARDQSAPRGPGGGRPGERKPPEPAPVLTFYEELTAPLAAPPPAAPKAAPRPAPRPAPEPERPAVEARTEAAAPPADALPPAAGGARRYTVQVGAFAARAQADALRARLAAAGWDAYVTEAEGAGARWRVRVGSYASREEARQAARRLHAERQLSGYVTLR